MRACPAAASRARLSLRSTRSHVAAFGSRSSRLAFSRLTGSSAGCGHAVVVAADAVLVQPRRDTSRPRRAALRAPRAGVGAGHRGHRRLRDERCTPRATTSSDAPARTFFIAATSALVFSAVFFSSLLVRQRRRLRRRIVRPEVHQLAQRRDDVFALVAPRLVDAADRCCICAGGGGGSGFSASSSGVRLSLLTASSFAPAATSARIASVPAHGDGLVQQRRAVRRSWRSDSAPACEQHLQRFDRLASSPPRGTAARRCARTPARRQTARRGRPPSPSSPASCRRSRSCRATARRGGVRRPGLFFTSAGLHSTFAPCASISFSASTSEAIAAR